jgi:hypothetical protein
VRRHVLLGLEALVADVDHADGLLEALLKAAGDGHDLADGLHAGADAPVDARELAQIPAGHLDHEVVERGLEAGRRLLGDGVLEVGQLGAERELGGDVGQRVAGGLAGQGRRAGQPGVHLDHGVVLRLGVQAVLDVALAHDAQVAHHLDRRRAQLVVLLVAHRLRGSHDCAVWRGGEFVSSACAKKRKTKKNEKSTDRLAGVDAHGVEVLHVTDGDGVALAVAHHLVLDLLPALHGLLDEDLRRGAQGLDDDALQLAAWRRRR